MKEKVLRPSMYLKRMNIPASSETSLLVGM